MTHKLKILPEYFEAVTSGEKTFEVRKDDRPFKVGDLLMLREFVPEAGGAFTGREITVKVTYILRGQYCKEGYCVLGIVRVGRWIPYDADRRGYTNQFCCTVCKNYSYTNTFQKECEFERCPCCGAEMDAGGGAENDRQY